MKPAPIGDVVAGIVALLESKGFIRAGETRSETVNLRDGRVMLVDDNGHAKGLPKNPKATALHRGVCRRGATGAIRGDVVIAYDEDFA